MKVGDIVTGNKGSREHYAITNEDCIMRVEQIYDVGVIKVRVLRNKKGAAINRTFNVDKRLFHHVGVCLK